MTSVASAPPVPATDPATAAASSPEPVAAEPLTVLIADDHPLFRRGVARAIGRRPGLTLVGEALDGREALELIDVLRPDVAVLDHRMPGLTGVEVCTALRERPDPPPTALLLLSAFEDTGIVADAVAAGAAGYVGKTASQGAICEAIERVGRGELAFTEATADGLEAALRGRRDGAGRA